MAKHPGRNGVTSENANEQPTQDLGFGSKASQQRQRLLNRDGSFNSERRGLPFYRSLNIYHTLLTMSWWKFNAMILLAYATVNFIFAWLYVLIGMEHINGIEAHSFFERYLAAFFFSTQTFTTVGYGHMSPIGLGANTVASLESLVGLLAFALATGMLYGRFSRPNAKILFSEHAVVAPYHGITGFMFRVANMRLSELIEVEAEVNLSLIEDVAGKRVRRFHELSLERARVNFFNLSWTVVHPITESSPLHGMTEPQLLHSEAEFLILLKGFDESFSQTVHARSSYRADEVLYRKRFTAIIDINESGKAMVDLSRIHDLESEES